VRVIEPARDMDLTVDELINELMKPISKDVWSSCTLCGARVKAGNMARHMAKVHRPSGKEI